MPGGDGTGPTREGPMTGGGFGPCGGANRRTAGGGFGRGGAFGGGRGWRNRRQATQWSGRRRTRAWTQALDEQDGLQREEKAIETELELLRARIAELEKSD